MLQSCVQTGITFHVAYLFRLDWLLENNQTVRTKAVNFFGYA